MRFPLIALCAWAACLCALPAAAMEPGAWTLSVDLNGRRLIGYPLLATEQEVSLLQRDGQIIDFPPGAVSDFKKVSSSFRPMTAGEMRTELLKELSPHLEVTGTGHYLVAHPKGQGAKWAQRFEELYRSMMLYFSKRGFRMNEPDFPLVAVVWPKREDFLRYAAASRSQVPPGVIGYYSPLDNRITLYDMAEGSGNSQAWQQNAATVVHEATHQTAFNTGVHRRMADTPKWIVEGLGTLFEARGVWDSARYPQQQDRINRERLDTFRQYQQAGRPPLGFMQVVADERLFSSNALAAYAEAWALTFYLTEKEPAKYGDFLTKTAALEPFARYSTEQRVKDFKAVFGSNLEMLEANYLRFIERLK